MKIKRLLSIFELAACSLMLTGGIFASYTTIDNAAKTGIKIGIEIPDREVYLKTGVWNDDSPVFFAHCFDGADAYDVQLAHCVDDVYKCEFSMIYKQVVFVRNAPGTTQINWDNNWGKTVDITIDLSKDTYEISGWIGDGIASGVWTNHTHTHEHSYETITPATGDDCAVKKDIEYCGICGEILSEITFIDHSSLTEHAYQAPTCTEHGHEHYYYCTHCKKYYEDADAKNEIVDESTIDIDALGHSYEHQHYGSDATNHWLICDNGCGETTAPVAHTFVNGVCSVCGYIQAHTHSYENHPAAAPSCTTAGNDQYYTCSGCDKIFDSNHNEIQSIPTIAALGHNYVNHECSRCHDIESGWTKVLFEATKDTGNGNSLIIVGSFNGWSTTSNYVALSWNDGNVWKGEIFLENGTSEYKAVHHVPGEGRYFWEYDPNHSVTLSGGTKTIKWSPSINYS